MARNLGIIVPFRNRPEHLKEFLPHLLKFFSLRAGSVSGRITVKIVEQESGLEFNRGLLKNIGYIICNTSCHYVCFHDVDYLPIFADYSETKGWAHVVSKGNERLLDPRGFEVVNNAKHFVGAVVIFSKRSFEKVNGYSNSYWGWGYEDSDLEQRCLLERILMQKRFGEFKLLPHANDGFDLIGGRTQPSQASIRNQRLFETRFPAGIPTLYRETSKISVDGLTSVKFTIVARKMIVNEDIVGDRFDVEIITVSV